MSEPSNQSTSDEPLQNKQEPTACSNCGASLHGEYCAFCGQRDTSVIRFFPTLLLEAFEGLFAFDSKSYRSLWFLFARPAFLTREYLAGRRVRYLAPMRLFVIFLIAFLFTISVQVFLNSVGININQETEVSEQSVLEEVETEFTAAVDELANEPGIDSDVDTDSNQMVFERTTDLDELETGVSELLANLAVPFLSEQNNQQFVALLQERAATNIEAISNDPSDFFNGLLENIPALLLLMIPVLALLQKLFYLGSGKYYVEHLVLTVHNHSFIFMNFILLFLLDLVIWTDFGIVPAIAGFLRSLLNFWAVVYLYLSLRRFFGQGYFITGVKFLTISISYGAFLIIGVLLFMLIGFFIY
ncbi:MAG: DUF3667 domain-containing protein [Gammaproteobacteria bacterium]|nr:DUF3667 domain-containing protein [Gammaproteobacteria bacterium]